MNHHRIVFGIFKNMSSAPRFRLVNAQLQRSSPRSARSGLSDNPLQRPRFHCPVVGCMQSFSGAAPLLAHVENIHLASDDEVPADFLASYQRWHCSTCQTLPLLSKPCRKCREKSSDVPRKRPRSGELAPSCRAHPHPEALADSSAAQRIARSYPSIKHVPKAARQLWAESLLHALSAVVDAPSLTRLRAVCDLLAATLGPVGRGG